MIYVEVTADVVGYLNEGYEYVCTCIADINGIKGMLGASAESSSIFSSCSESGANEAVKAVERKEANELALAEANERAVL